MAEQTKETDEPVHQPETCDPCSIHKKTSQATTLCIDCEENLCEICTKTHATRKVTKEHKPVPVQEKKKSLTKNCDSCTADPQEAFKYCTFCEEYLCSDCVNEHSKRKATKNHVPVDVASIQQQSAESDEADRHCDICLQAGQKVKAEYFCQQCTELLCLDCNNVHRNSKATRTHKPTPAADMPDSINMNESRKCEPCGLSNKEKPAVKYCEECEELLCDDCSRRHGLQKSTLSHLLRNASDINSSGQCCDLCIKCSEINPAVLFCQICSEALCENCVRSHKNQRATKTHKLLPLKEKSSEETAQETKLCDLCEKRNIQNSSKLL